MVRPKDVNASAVEAEVARIQTLSKYELIVLWRKTIRSEPPRAFTKGLLARYLAYRVQEQAFGGLDRATKKLLDDLAHGRAPTLCVRAVSNPVPSWFANIRASATL